MFIALTKDTIKNIVSVKTGKKYNHKNLQGSDGSFVSTKNTIWINKGDKKKPKWGMVDAKGKVLLSCKYSSIDPPTEGYQRIRDYATGKYGAYSIKAGDIKLTPVVMEGEG